MGRILTESLTRLVKILTERLTRLVKILTESLTRLVKIRTESLTRLVRILTESLTRLVKIISGQLTDLTRPAGCILTERAPRVSPSGRALSTEFLNLKNSRRLELLKPRSGKKKSTRK